MRRAGTAGETSLLFLAASLAGYLTWLAYGLMIGDLPLIVVDAVGATAAGRSVAVTWSLRRSARRATELDDALSVAQAVPGAALENRRALSPGDADRRLEIGLGPSEVALPQAQFAPQPPQLGFVEERAPAIDHRKRLVGTASASSECPKAASAWACSPSR